MVKASASAARKVNRAARTGGVVTGRRANTSLGFYLIVLLIIVAGSAGVWYFRSERLKVQTPPAIEMPTTAVPGSVVPGDPAATTVPGAPAPAPGDPAATTVPGAPAPATTAPGTPAAPATTAPGTPAPAAPAATAAG